MPDTLQTYLTALADLFYPERCVGCERRASDVLCRACFDSLPSVGSPVCGRCGLPTAFATFVCEECKNVDFGFQSARAPLKFDGVGQKIVHALKYRGYKRVVEKLAAPSTTWRTHTALCPFNWSPLKQLPEAISHDQRRRRQGHCPAPGRSLRQFVIAQQYHCATKQRPEGRKDEQPKRNLSSGPKRARQSVLRRSAYLPPLIRFAPPTKVGPSLA